MPVDQAPAQAVLWSPGLSAPCWQHSADTSGHSLPLLGTDVAECKINVFTPGYLSTQQLSWTLNDFSNEQIKAVAPSSCRQWMWCTGLSDNFFP